MLFDQLKRREFITLLGGTVAAGTIARLPAAMAQHPGKMPLVGILTPAATDATPIFEGFRKGLRDLGYVDGKSCWRVSLPNSLALPWM
jgi:hypothetical protein